jgi:hypothetical protein
MTMDEWIERQLASRPPRSEAWKEDMRRFFGLKSRSAGPDDLDTVGVEPGTTARLIDHDGIDALS